MKVKAFDGVTRAFASNCYLPEGDVGFVKKNAWFALKNYEIQIKVFNRARNMMISEHLHAQPVVVQFEKLYHCQYQRLAIRLRIAGL